MKKKSKIHSKNSMQMPTLVGANTNFEGKLSGSESICIEGSFKGEIDSQGNVYINKQAQVKAQITAQNVIVNGEIKGDIWAKETLDIGNTGKIYGNIKTSKLIIASGGFLDGYCTMDEKIEVQDKSEKNKLKNILDENKLENNQAACSTPEQQKTVAKPSSKTEVFNELFDTVQEDQ